MTPDNASDVLAQSSISSSRSQESRPVLPFMTIQTSQPSSFDTCHQVKLTYPAFSPDIKSGETVGKTGKTFVSWYFLQPHDVRFRYYPHQHLNAEGEPLPAPSPDEHAFSSLYPTDATNEGSFKFFQSDPWVMGIGKFVGNVANATRYIGTTELRIDTFQAGNKKEPELERCLLVEARVKYANNRRQDYRIDVARFLVPLDIARLRRNQEQCHSQWLSDLIDLLERRSDRAVKHFDAQLDRRASSLAGSDAAQRLSVHRSDNWLWKPARLPQYELAIDQMYWQTRREISSFLWPSFMCGRCGDEGHLTPLCSLDCDHRFCRACLLIICNQYRVPGEARCLQCLKDVFTKPLVLQFLSPGSTWKWYFADTRYSSWENWERSCLDLVADERHDKISMVVNRRVLTNFWRQLVRKASEEPPESCPAHLRVDNWPEFQDAQTVIFERLKVWNGRSKTFFDLREDLMAEMKTKFRERVLSEPLRTYMPVFEREKVQNRSSESLSSLFRRPGLCNFIEKMIRLTLTFWVMRPCDCKEAQATNDLYHHHGTRPFFYIKTSEVQDIDQPLKTPSEEQPMWKADEFPDPPEEDIASNLGEMEAETPVAPDVRESAGTQESLVREVASAAYLLRSRTSERVVGFDEADHDKPTTETLTPPADPKPDTTLGIEDELNPSDIPATNPVPSSGLSSRAALGNKESTPDVGHKVEIEDDVPATLPLITRNLLTMLTLEPQLSTSLRTQLEKAYHVVIGMHAWKAALIALEQDGRAIVENEGIHQTVRAPDSQQNGPSPETSRATKLPDKSLHGVGRGVDDRDDTVDDHTSGFRSRTTSDVARHVAERRAAMTSAQARPETDLVPDGPGPEETEAFEDEGTAGSETAQENVSADEDIVGGPRDTQRFSDTKSPSSLNDQSSKKSDRSEQKTNNQPGGWGTKETRKDNKKKKRKKERMRDEAAAVSAPAQPQAPGGQTQTAAANAPSTQVHLNPATVGLLDRIFARLFSWRS